MQNGCTAVMHASQFGHLTIVQYLVEQGAAINAQDEVRNSISSMYYLGCLLCYYYC